MNGAEALERARAGFDRRLGEIGASEWDKATPCTDWSVRRVANHVVGCAYLYTMLLRGVRGTDVVGSLRDIDHLGEHPVGAARAAWGELAAALAAPGALEGMVHHPVGDLPASWLAVTAVEELTVHGWDLARATGGDEAIDEEVAAWLVPPLREMIPAFGAVFRAPAVSLGDGATASAQLLQLTGRAG